MLPLTGKQQQYMCLNTTTQLATSLHVIVIFPSYCYWVINCQGNGDVSNFLT